MKNIKSKSIILGVVAALVGTFFFSHPAYAAFSASISRSGTVNIAEAGSSTIRPTSIGTLGTGADVVTVTTNCTAGYNLYVSATSSGGTNLALADGSDYIPTSSTAVGSETTLARDTWGVGKTASAFSGLQDYAIDVSELTPFYTGSSTSDYTFYYGVNVSTAKTPGTYSGEVLYTVLMNSACVSYTLNFDDNGATTSTLVSRELNFGDTIDLAEISAAVSKTGYTLTGWQDQDGNTYGITGEANVNPNNKGAVTLTAIWEEDIITMQAWAADNGCSALSTNQYLTLKDARDDEKYVVKKLADGKCWMAQNLRLTNFKLTSADSDVSSDFDLTTDITYSGSSGWCTTNSSTCDDVKAVYYNSSEASDSSKSSYYGALYNWYTATAGTGKYATSSGNATSSICPKGWRLPTGGPDGDFVALDKAWGGDGSNRSNANTYSTFTGTYASGGNGGFGLAGYIDGSLQLVGSYGVYWSSSAYSSSHAYDLQLRSGTAYMHPQDAYYKYYGRSVRCIADTPTMQDFSCSTLPAGTSATLRDARDNQEYIVYRFPTDVKYAGTSTVANVAGKCIMTKDLNLGAVASVSGASSTIVANGTMTLSPDDSGFTTPTGSGEDISVPTSNVAVTNGTGSWGSNSSTYNTYSNKMYTTSGTGNYAGRGYYSWGAAMAACPKGWRLPTSDEYNNSNSLESSTTGISAIVKGDDVAATISNTTGSPYSFTLGGDYYGRFDNAPSHGYYWSSTQSGSTNSYHLDISSSKGMVRYSLGKYLGFAVRCIAK